MEKMRILKIGTDNKVKNLNLFVEFLSARFPDESDNITSYFTEWAERFNTGAPHKYMDSESLKIYNELIYIELGGLRK